MHSGKVNGFLQGLSSTHYSLAFARQDLSSIRGSHIVCPLFDNVSRTLRIEHIVLVIQAHFKSTFHQNHVNKRTVLIARL